MRHAATKESSSKGRRRLSKRSSPVIRQRIPEVPFPNAMDRPNPTWLPDPIEDWDGEELNLDRYGIFVREDD
ncbi:MAG: hypothetical protein ACKVQT_14475 [Burkholderiales bacterium]